MRTFLAFVVAAGALCAQDAAKLRDEAEALYRFKVGTEWKYQVKVGDEKQEMTRKVTSVTDLETVVESVQGPRANKQTIVWLFDGKHVVECLDSKMYPQAKLFKVGAKKGDTWRYDYADEREKKATFDGPCEIEVPAGKYKDALKVTLDGGPPFGTCTFHYVPKVGLVRMAVEGCTIELAEFKPGK